MYQQESPPLKLQKEPKILNLLAWVLVPGLEQGPEQEPELEPEREPDHL
jgi:hypothetical protein